MAFGRSLGIFGFRINRPEPVFSGKGPPQTRGPTLASSTRRFSTFDDDP